jgi:hypothetical protein
MTIDVYEMKEINSLFYLYIENDRCLTVSASKTNKYSMLSTKEWRIITIMMMNHLYLLMSCIRDTQQIFCSLSLTCQIKKNTIKEKINLIHWSKINPMMFYTSGNVVYHFFSSLASISIKYLFEWHPHTHSYPWYSLVMLQIPLES